MTPAINIQAEPTPLMYNAGKVVSKYVVGDDLGQVVADDAGNVIVDDQ